MRHYLNMFVYISHTGHVRKATYIQGNKSQCYRKKYAGYKLLINRHSILLTFSELFSIFIILPISRQILR